MSSSCARGSGTQAPLILTRGDNHARFFDGGPRILDEVRVLPPPRNPFTTPRRERAGKLRAPHT